MNTPPRGKPSNDATETATPGQRPGSNACCDAPGTNPGCRPGVMRRFGLVVAISVLAALVAAGPATRPDRPDRPSTRPGRSAEPATRPAGRPSPFGNRMVRLKDLGLAAPDWPQPGGDRVVRDEEWQEVVAFAKDNFPNRWKTFEEVQTKRGDNDQLVKQLKDRFTGRYRLLMRIQRMMPGLYEAAIKQGQLEDDAWAAVINYRKQTKNTALAEQMRQKVDALVRNLLQERQSRLDALKLTIAEEQKQLDDDRDNVDDLVNRQITRLSGDDPGNDRSFRREMWNGGGGGGGQWGGMGGRGWDRNDPSEFQYAKPPTTAPAK